MHYYVLIPYFLNDQNVPLHPQIPLGHYSVEAARSNSTQPFIEGLSAAN